MKKLFVNRILLSWYLIVAILFLTGCDAMVHMVYVVKNQSKNEMTLFVPNYPVDNLLTVYGKRKDTTLILKPKESIVVGINSKIDFPWGRKNIYRFDPGMCGLKKINHDISLDLGCSKKEWKYRNGMSIMFLK